MHWPRSHSHVQIEFRFSDFKAVLFSAPHSCLAPSRNAVVLIKWTFAELCCDDKHHHRLVACNHEVLFSYPHSMSCRGRRGSTLCCFHARRRSLYRRRGCSRGSEEEWWRTAQWLPKLLLEHRLHHFCSHLGQSKSYNQWDKKCPPPPVRAPRRGPVGWVW